MFGFFKTVHQQIYSNAPTKNAREKPHFVCVAPNRLIRLFCFPFGAPLCRDKYNPKGSAQKGGKGERVRKREKTHVLSTNVNVFS